MAQLENTRPPMLAHGLRYLGKVSEDLLILGGIAFCNLSLQVTG